MLVGVYCAHHILIMFRTFGKFKLKHPICILLTVLDNVALERESLYLVTSIFVKSNEF
jgi:hypothetical protein